jgi:hypothetical protein
MTLEFSNPSRHFEATRNQLEIFQCVAHALGAKLCFRASGLANEFVVLAKIQMLGRTEQV